MDTKNISSLVTDIYKLLESGKAKIDASVLGSLISKRLSKEESGPALRISNIGEKCTRKLWYRQHKPELAEDIPGHTRIKFLVGDILEETIMSLAEQAGHKVEGRQDEVELHGVKGHIDGIVDGCLLDVKSANSRSMDKFKGHRLEYDDPFGYLDQLGGYYEALESDPRITTRGEAAFLAIDKELGHIVVDRYKLKSKPWREILAGIKNELKKPTPPPRAYQDEPDGKSGNRQIPMPCRYCQYKKVCWADANGGTGLKEFIYANGPKWLTRVMRQPDVREKVNS